MSPLCCPRPRLCPSPSVSLLLPIWSTICGHLPPLLLSPIPSSQPPTCSSVFAPLPCLDLSRLSGAKASEGRGVGVHCLSHPPGQNRVGVGSDPRKHRLCPEPSQSHPEKCQLPDCGRIGLQASLPLADVPVVAVGLEGSATLGADQASDRSSCMFWQSKKEAGRIQASGESSGPAGAAAATGHKRGGSWRGMNTETKWQDKGPGKEPAMEKVGKEERATQEMGRGQQRGAVQRAPMGRGREERRHKEQEKENKGAVGVNSPHPSLPELWSCRGDCLRGSGPRRGWG